MAKLPALPPAPLASAEVARQFILAGNATFTLKSKASGAHFTFRVRAPQLKEGERDNGFRFVSAMTGSDNESSFSYFGYIKAGGLFCFGGAKAKVGYETASVKAFMWAWQKLAQDAMPESLEVWHEGRCGRCARKLTHPSSLASGFGPECVQHVGFMAVAA
jgi:Family of unknown function (DUF6011)